MIPADEQCLGLHGVYFGEEDVGCLDGSAPNLSDPVRGRVGNSESTSGWRLVRLGVEGKRA
jgi:hypothetical protein